MNDFGRYGQASRDILIPQVHYLTNDSWEVVSAGRPLSGGVSGYPILHRAMYSKGTLYVLTIPEDFGQLYDYPSAALGEIRRILSKDLDLYLEGPAKVGLFLYDNRTVIVENFNDEPVDVKLCGDAKLQAFTDLESGETVPATVSRAPQGRGFAARTAPPAKAAFTVPPHSYRAFRYE